MESGLVFDKGAKVVVVFIALFSLFGIGVGWLIWA